MIVLGCDPGKKGALVWIEETDGKVKTLLVIELRHVVWQPRLIWAALEEAPVPDRIAFEAPQAARTAGGNMGSGTLGIGQRWEMLHTIFILLWPEARMWTPTATNWMAAALKDQPPGSTKDKTASLCQSELPDLELIPGRCRVVQDGISDAGAVALWGLARR